jgi:prolyl-tRNA editing enzyme YbaK/EbsC (Cys-tRNA(Pro) deacylase)
MSLQSVRDFLAERAPDIAIVEAATSTATVALAAAAHGVEPERIAKTLSLRLDGDVILVVMSGTARLDNRKYKDRFGAKAKMLDAAEVLEATSHPVGGVCPFGLPGRCASTPMCRSRRLTSSFLPPATRITPCASPPSGSCGSPAPSGSTSPRPDLAVCEFAGDESQRARASPGARDAPTSR